MATELKAQMEKALELIEASDYCDWFDFKEMRDEWHRYQNGNQDSSFHLWQWMNFSFLVAKFENNGS
ncbi:MAG: hypothetical protein RQ756_06525, partial [Flavobacteriaceae bacterium]|nr:hypothetical protein [Flavobacteriaceae bacterium]